MKLFLQKYCNLEKILQFCIASFLFLLPWQTIWITREQFLNGSKWQYGTLGFFATEILLWGALLFFILYFIQQKKRKTGSFRTPFTFSKDRIFLLSLMVFLAYVYASFFWSWDPPKALQTSLQIMEAILLFLILQSAVFSFKQLLQYFIAAATIQSIFGIYQFLTQSTFTFKWLGLVSHPIWEAGTSVLQGEGVGRVLRAYAAFSHPNVFGGYLVLALIILLFGILFSSEQESVKKYFFEKTSIFFCIFGLLYIALFFTFSRSAWLSLCLFLIGIFLFFFVYLPLTKTYSNFFEKKKIFLLKFYFFLLMLSGVLFARYWPLVHMRVEYRSPHEIQSIQERITGYRESLQIWESAPWFGVGAGNYTRAAYEQSPYSFAWNYQPVHNVPFLFLSEFGIVGLLLFLVSIITFYIFQKSLYLKQENKGIIVYCVVLSLSCFFLLSLFDHYLLSSSVGLLFSSIFFAFIFRFSLEKEQK